jgi:hypothetical protein
MAASDKTWVDNSPPQVTASDLNGFENENNNLIESVGMSLNTTDNFQTAKAVAAYAANGDFYTDSGTANAYVLSVQSNGSNPYLAPPSYFKGMRLRFFTSNKNTGASTVNAAGLGNLTIILPSGNALTGGEISGSATDPVELICNGAGSAILISNRVFGFQKITSSGNFVVPNNVTKIFVSGVAGGGGGGGAAGCPANTDSASGGGGGGGSGDIANRLSIDVIPGETLTVTIGAKGTGGAGGAAGSNPGSNGNNGTDTLLARGVTNLLTLTGGVAGKGSPVSTVTTGMTDSGQAGNNGATAGGNGFWETGDIISGYGGIGGSNQWGFGGEGGQGGTTTGFPGGDGGGNGTGGGGGSGTGSSTGFPASAGGDGGDGADGCLVIEW